MELKCLSKDYSDWLLLGLVWLLVVALHWRLWWNCWLYVSLFQCTLHTLIGLPQSSISCHGCRTRVYLKLWEDP